MHKDGSSQSLIARHNPLRCTPQAASHDRGQRVSHIGTTTIPGQQTSREGVRTQVAGRLLLENEEKQSLGSAHRKLGVRLLPRS